MNNKDQKIDCNNLATWACNYLLHQNTRIISSLDAGDVTISVNPGDEFSKCYRQEFTQCVKDEQFGSDSNSKISK